MLFKLLKLVIIGAAVIGLTVFIRSEIIRYWNDKLSKEAKDFKVAASILDTKPKPAAVVNDCAKNDLDQLILVSISQRHLWACEGSQTDYSSPVVTGMEFLAADLTPTGTYHIYAKETDIHLIGHDGTGSWNDFVYYWMPFLDNQYGAYGFHDATWRPTDAFGNISPDSSNASHGCVECPIATAEWLYNWSQVGTTVTIES